MTIDVEKAVVVNEGGNCPGPPLMLVFKNRLRGEDIERIRRFCEDALVSDKALVIESSEVYQLLDGRWQPLRTRPEPR